MLQRQSCFTSRIRQGSDATMVPVMSAIKPNAFNSSGQCLLGYRFTDRLSRTLVSAVRDGLTNILISRADHVAR